MAESKYRQTIAVSYPYPPMPKHWNQEERSFYIGVRRLFDQLFSKNSMYPIGIVVFTATENKPFSFGVWEQITTGITGVYGWKRIS